MKKDYSPWKSVDEELPIIDDEHEEGEVPYLVNYCEDEY